jgi:hypothetical protein
MSDSTWFATQNGLTYFVPFTEPTVRIDVSTARDHSQPFVHHRVYLRFYLQKLQLLALLVTACRLRSPHPYSMPGLWR